MQQQQYQQNGQRYTYNFTNRQMRHYFYKVPLLYKQLILLGVALCIAKFLLPSLSEFSTFSLILGVVFLVWGGIPFLIYTDCPSDQQYADWVIERSKPLYKAALQRLHIDESQCENIIEIQGGISSLHQLTKKFPNKEIVVKRLPNGLRHYSINMSTYIFLARDEIAIYSGYMNALAQEERFEDADHYYYQAIVGVSTSGPIYTFRNGIYASHGQPYKIVSTSGPVVYALRNASPEEGILPEEEEMQMQGFFVRINNGDIVGTDYATSVILRSGENRVEIQGVDKVVAALLALLRDHKVTVIEANKISKDII